MYRAILIESSTRFWLTFAAANSSSGMMLHLNKSSSASFSVPLEALNTCIQVPFANLIAYRSEYVFAPDSSSSLALSMKMTIPASTNTSTISMTAPI
jgi:hypothetical protein